MQFTPLLVPLSHIYRQLLASNKIRPEALNLNFNPANHGQSLSCEFHQGAPGHTLNNCWRLREKIQKMIDNKELSFIVVRPPNVQANLLPDHGSSLGPTINIISVCAVEEDRSKPKNPTPVVIEYVPIEDIVGFTRSGATPTLFVIEVPAREPYRDSRIPWTYKGSVGSLEQQMRVIRVTRLGRVYEGPHVKNKGKAPMPVPKVTPEISPVPTKKVIEEEAEAFMKESHREALLGVLTAAQMNVNFNRIRLSKTPVRAFNGSRREVNGEVDLLIDVGPCSFAVTFHVLDIPNAFSYISREPGHLQMFANAFLTGLPGHLLHIQLNGTQKHACTRPRVTTTREQVSDCFPELIFVIEYIPAETAVGFMGFGAVPTPFVIEIPTREPYQDSKVPWTYEGSVGNLEQQFSVIGVTHSGRVYENQDAASKGKVLAAAFGAVPEATPIPLKKVTEEEAEAFLKIIKVRDLEPYREALLKVLTATQVPKETTPNRIGETVASIFSNTISFSDDELPSEGWAHSRALHIVCKCNNFAISRVMINNGSALNVCSVSTLKQMNVDFNHIRPNKTAIRAFDGSRRKVNGEIDLLINVGPCSFSVTFQVIDIPNIFGLLLGRPWIHSAGAIPLSLHQRLKFTIEERLIMVKGEEDYAIYKETAVPYINIGNDENLPFHSFETSPLFGATKRSRDRGSTAPSRLKSTKTGGDSVFAPPATRLSRPAGASTFTISLFYFFPGPPHIIGNTLDNPSLDSNAALVDLPAICAVIEETPSGGLHRPRVGE
ncbi:hypothetical protein CRG98_001146 [Punica granatum]|uniref:Uncharacterized protein n=1 Tax=Punica granatum TaxID=22663 RepID=A0A2I0LE60_PUNGR|nr:hypothetical protein CRG98_001146 [Punica granatum]